MTQNKVISTTYRHAVDQQSVATAANSFKTVGEAGKRELAEIRKQSDANYVSLVKQNEAVRQLAATYKSGDVAAIAKVEADAAQAAQRHGDSVARLAAVRERAVASSNAQMAALNELSSAWDRDVAAIIAYDKAAQAASATNERLTQTTGALKARLEDAARVQASRESGGFVGDLRGDAFGGGASGGGTAGLQQALFKLRQGLVALPGVGTQSTLTLGVRGAEAVAGAATSLTQVAAAAGIAAPAAIAVAVALARFNDGLAASKRRLDAALQAQNAYYQATTTLTTEDAQARIEQLKRVREAQEQQLAETRNALDTGFQAVQTSVGGQVTFVGDALARIFDSQSGASELRAQAEGLETQLNATTDEITRLTQGIENGVFARNEARAAAEAAAEAEKKLQAARETAAQQLISEFEEEAQTRVRLAALRRSGTTEQINAEIDANNDRAAIIRNFLLPAVDSMGLSTQAARDKTAELNDELKDLYDTNELLRTQVAPLVRLREAEAKAAEALVAQSDGINDALTEMRDNVRALAEASKDAAETQAALTEAYNDHASNVAKIQQERDEKIAEGRKKANDQLVKLDEQASQRIRDLKARDNLSILEAIARGDIAQAQSILARQKLEVEQQKRDTEQRKKDTEDQYQEQEEAQRKQADKLLRAEQDRYAKERDQRQQAHNRALEQERALLNAQESLRALNAFRTQYYASVVQSANYAVATSHENAAARILNVANSLLAGAYTAGGAVGQAVNSGAAAVNQALADFYEQYYATGGGGGVGGGWGGAQPTPFAEGGFTKYGGLAQLHPNEAVFRINPADRQPLRDSSGLRQPTLTFNIDARGAAMSEGEYRRITREEVAPLIRAGQVEVVTNLATIERKMQRGGRNR